MQFYSLINKDYFLELKYQAIQTLTIMDLALSIKPENKTLQYSL